MSIISVIVFSVMSIVTEGLIFWGIFEESIRLAMHITNFFTCVNLALGIFTSVAYAYQYSYLYSLSQLVYTGLNVFFTVMLLFFGAMSSLVLFAVINGLTNVLGNVFLYIQIKTRIKPFSVSFSKPTKELISPIMSMGFQFFILQICGMILYSTDNLIINTLFGSSEVTKYSIITKIYTAGENLYSIILINLWSAATYQWQRKRYGWIWGKVKYLLVCWLFYSLGVVIVSFNFNWIVSIWLGKEAIHFECELVILFAFYAIAMAFGSIFVNIANGIGKIKLQLCVSSIEAILNIPLSIFFSQNLGMGILGVKLATLICCIGAIVIMPLYITFLFKRKLNNA